MPRLAVEAWDGGATEIDPAETPVLVVEFWATWCRPCRTLMPAMVRLLRKIDDPRLRVVAINIESDGALVERFVDQVLPERGLPLYRDPQNRLMGQLGAPGMPTTYVAVDGVVRGVYVGYSADAHHAMERLIRESLAEPPNR